MGRPFRHGLRVRYAECDPQGIVFNGNYLHYFDIAVTELYRDAIGGWSEMETEGVDAVVAEATIRYLSSLRFDEEIELVTSVERLGDTSMTLALAIERDGDTCATGSLRYVFLDAASGEKSQMPPRLRKALDAYK